MQVIQIGSEILLQGGQYTQGDQFLEKEKT